MCVFSIHLHWSGQVIDMVKEEAAVKPRVRPQAAGKEYQKNVILGLTTPLPFPIGARKRAPAGKSVKFMLQYNMYSSRYIMCITHTIPCV